VEIFAELNQFVKLISPEATGEIFTGKSNEKIWEELNSTEKHSTRVLAWLDARIAHEMAKRSKGVAAR
jgi:hypothetical protein